MFLIGAAKVADIKGKEVVIQGSTRAWLERRRGRSRARPDRERDNLILV